MRRRVRVPHRRRVRIVRNLRSLSHQSPSRRRNRASTLQTKPAGEEGDVERGIRSTLTRATTDLNRVDYRTLNTDARAQYDYAKRFVRQAEDALRQKNLVFAKTVADKAAALAAQLAGR